MEHVAIDLGGRESQVCVRSPDGKVVEECRLLTRSLPTWLKHRPPSRVVVETCAEAFGIADAALRAAHQVRVVPATLVRTLGVGARGIKTDVRDARILSEVSARIDLPSVHIPSHQARERKTLCGMRDVLVSSRTMTINAVRGWMRAQAVTPRTGHAESFPERAAAALKDTAVPTYVTRLLETLDVLNAKIRDADKELEQLAKADPTCPRLMTVPGVGPVTAVRFCAALDQISRFSSAAHVQAYLGLTPGENSSSNRVQRTGITKAGPPALRASLIQAAWAAKRSRTKHPMLEWANEVEKRRGKRVAIVALARKLAGIMFAIWRDGTFYDRKHFAPKPAEAIA